MSIFSRKKKQQLNDVDTTDPHIGRYNFEYGILPSSAAYQPMMIFSPGIEGTECIEMMLGDMMKTSEWAKQYAKEVVHKIYNLNDCTLSLFKFPEPKSSPELIFAASVLPTKLTMEMKEEEDLEYRPYYILAKVVDAWVIGEVQPRRDIGNDYFTTYYERMVKPNPIQFIEWILNREGLGKGKNLEEIAMKSDPIAKYLYEREKKSSEKH